MLRMSSALLSVASYERLTSDILLDKLPVSAVTSFHDEKADVGSVGLPNRELERVTSCTSATTSAHRPEFPLTSLPRSLLCLSLTSTL